MYLSCIFCLLSAPIQNLPNSMDFHLVLFAWIERDPPVLPFCTHVERFVKDEFTILHQCGLALLCVYVTLGFTKRFVNLPPGSGSCVRHWTSLCLAFILHSETMTDSHMIRGTNPTLRNMPPLVVIRSLSSLFYHDDDPQASPLFSGKATV